ncbi:uncharacterized protein TNCT_66041 [Trichonephila clavata]|uniref:SWIM-type domain-containing protein n=1 Tax=Trichonephila clavata TaxID=2740835 RepID=A0A8X6F7Q1_TRICU|nr:uncharacterized protein TNCT_66041 [Trichonephila clavata]
MQNIICPAIIKVRQSTENVVVQYFPNHENQLEHLRLSESDRAAVAGRLKEGVSEKKFCRILEKKLLLTVAEKCSLKKRISIILKGTSILMVILKGMELMHDRLGQEIQSNRIEKLADNEWKIESNHSNYIICKKEEECHRLCSIKCTACKICIHFYTCSCVDNLRIIRENICKHIHKVAKMFLNDTHNEEIQEIYVNQNDILKETFDVLPCSSKSANNDGHESKKRKIESILALIDEYELTLEEESKIHRNLDSILNIFYNKKEHNNKKVKIMESSTIDIKKKIEKQPAYFSTRKKRYTAGTLKNPTTEEVNNIKEGLLLNSQEIISINTDFYHTYI